MRKRTPPAFSLGALALGLVAAVAAAPAARADGSDGLGTDALVATVPRDGSGWRNGAAVLRAKGDGGYSLSYSGAASGGAGVGREATVTGNQDGNPSVEYRAVPAARTLAQRS